MTDERSLTRRALGEETAPEDWPEDRSRENGSYANKCCMCSCAFIGHKRRVSCKLCADYSAEAVAPREQDRAKKLAKIAQRHRYQTNRVPADRETAQTWWTLADIDRGWLLEELRRACQMVREAKLRLETWCEAVDEHADTLRETKAWAADWDKWGENL